MGIHSFNLYFGDQFLGHHNNLLKLRACSNVWNENAFILKEPECSHRRQGKQGLINTKPLMEITDFDADCFSDPGLHHALLTFCLFSGRWKEKQVRRAPFSSIKPLASLSCWRGKGDNQSEWPLGLMMMTSLCASIPGQPKKCTFTPRVPACHSQMISGGTLTDWERKRWLLQWYMCAVRPAAECLVR